MSTVEQGVADDDERVHGPTVIAPRVDARRRAHGSIDAAHSRWMTTWWTSWTVAVAAGVDGDGVVARDGQRVRGAARSGRGDQPALVRRLHRGQHVGAAARRRQGDQHVAGPAVGADGPDEGIVDRRSR